MSNDRTGEVLVYTDPGGLVRVQVRLQDGSVWLSQAQMADLNGTTPQNITQHVRSIYDEGEQAPEATCKSFLHVRREGQRDVQRSMAGQAIRKTDVSVAKNYLNAEEIEALNRIVSAYLDFAELQAMSRRAMTMDAWIAKLDEFLRLADREVLTHAGRVSAEAAKNHAEAAFTSWRTAARALPEPVDVAFEAAIRETRAIEKQRPRTRTRKGDA